MRCEETPVMDTLIVNPVVVPSGAGPEPSQSASERFDFEAFLADVRRSQQIVRKYIKADVLLSEELIAERRREAQKEQGFE